MPAARSSDPVRMVRPVVNRTPAVRAAMPPSSPPTLPTVKITPIMAGDRLRSRVKKTIWTAYTMAKENRKVCVRQRKRADHRLLPDKAQSGGKSGPDSLVAGLRAGRLLVADTPQKEAGADKGQRLDRLQPALTRRGHWRCRDPHATQRIMSSWIQADTVGSRPVTNAANGARHWGPLVPRSSVMLKVGTIQEDSGEHKRGSGSGLLP